MGPYNIIIRHPDVLELSKYSAKQRILHPVIRVKRKPPALGPAVVNAHDQSRTSSTISSMNRGSANAALCTHGVQYFVGNVPA